MSGTEYLDRSGGRVAYDDSGGTGPLIIAAPGMGDTRRVYRHVGPALIEGGVRFVTMDMRGMGESSVDWPDLSDAAIASDYLALVDHLDAGPAVLVGNSLSCASAVIAATESLEKVAGLALIGPFVRNVPVKRWQKALTAVMLAPLWGRRAWVGYYRKNLYPGPKPPDHEDYVRALSANLSEPGRFASLRTVASNSHAESGRRLPDVKQPVVVVMGTADPDFPDAVAEANHIGEVTGAEVVLVEGSGHYPQADSPDLVAPALLDLVGRSGQ